MTRHKLAQVLGYLMSEAERDGRIPIDLNISLMAKAAADAGFCVAEEQPAYQADLELAPDWNLTYERMVTHADGLQDALEQDTQRLQKLGVKCVLITLTVVELKQ